MIKCIKSLMHNYADEFELPEIKIMQSRKSLSQKNT